MKMFKMQNWLKLTIIFSTITYLLLLLFPTIYFSNSFEYKGFRVYYASEEVNHIELQKLFDDTEQLLIKSELYKSNIKQNIFICQNKMEYVLFTIFHGSELISYYPFKHTIFINRTIKQTENNNLQVEENKQNSFSNIIANTVVLSLLEEELGFQKYLRLPKWKKIGYASMISKCDVYNETFGYSKICVYNYIGDKNYRRFKYWILTKYLLDDENVSLHDFLHEEISLKKINDQYCR